MKKEEMKQLNENKKALELTIKNNSKLYGYKTVSGFVYKIIGGVINYQSELFPYVPVL
ncbi:MAG: hypothetical protein LBK58_07500 [Prevotellaceae bacterium]|jgi:hypothetical protein|nr:hypothetical protein [Prevotellaceae bacterium]